MTLAIAGASSAPNSSSPIGQKIRGVSVIVGMDVPPQAHPEFHADLAGLYVADV